MRLNLNPRSRRDTYGSRINRDHSPLLAYAIPPLTIMIASLLPTLPVAVVMPLVPPLGFLMLLAWRIVRPGLLPVWAGFPLGLFDDLFSGQPFGCAIVLWSLAMLAMELLETRFPWRGFLQDWATVTLITTIYLLASAAFSGATLTAPLLAGMAPQWLVSVIVFPLIAQLVAWLDRFRLLRVKVIG